MRPFERQPDSCEFLEKEQGAVEPNASCRLAQQLLINVAKDHHIVRVNNDICQDCCRYPLPSGPCLNPVVASLVFAAANKIPTDVETLKTSDLVELEQIKQFAKSHLPMSRTDAEALESELACHRSDGNQRKVRHEISASPIKPSNRREKLRIGLVGYNSGYGLNYLNRDIAFHLGIDRWLSPTRDTSKALAGWRIDTVARPMSQIELAAWMKGLDVVLFVENPLYFKLTSVAKQLGIRVVCVPMWEWLHPGMDWLKDVDLMLCPTRHTEDILSAWKSKFRFEWNVDYISWPVDQTRLQFRQRWFCRNFVYIHGSGGAIGATRNADYREFRRKGFDVLVSAARLIPHIPITVYAFDKNLPDDLPPNLKIRPQPDDNTVLYRNGDVCVLPSHWEGLGLPLLECQAAGMPLVTTDAAPMNEHNPWKRIPVYRQDMAGVSRDIFIPYARIQPEQLAKLMQNIYGRFIGIASWKARRFIEREHNWITAAPKILLQIQKLFSSTTPRDSVNRLDSE